ncbi:ATP-binding protein [Bradyrhizobium sp.]|uniref:hybrid sensor histidine kinase/response regulator n=1 Tax=Bradyrhizobium sp. TaxID=376 RepID=UPI003C4B9F07
MPDELSTGIFLEGADASDDALRRREEQLRLATESSEVGLWDVDPIADKLCWPPRVKAMFGISADVEVSMADFYAGLHPEDLPHTAASYAAACDPSVRSLYDAEYRTIGKEDGIIRWVAAKGRGLFNDRGECIRVIGTAIDITAKKSAIIRETFLLGLLDRLRHLTEPTAIIAEAIAALGQQLGANRVGYGQMLDDDSTIMLATCYVNGVAPITGQFQAESFGAHNIALQRRGETVVVPDVEADPRNDFDLWAGIGTRSYVSVPLLRGGRFRASLFVNRRDPHRWDRHEVALIEDVARRLWDAVDRARAEEALRVVNASLEQQVDARTRERDRIWRLSPVVMAVGDRRGVLIEANPAWVNNLGWSLEETLGHDVMEFVAPGDREAGAAGMAQLFEGKPVVEYKLGFLHKNGQRRIIAWTTVPEGDRLYGFGRDITEQTLVEEQLRQSQKMEALGHLTGGIAHDFNNLLQGVTGTLDLIRRKPSDETSVRRWAEAGLHAAQRGSKLTGQLLAFSRAEELELKSVRIQELVQKMSDLLDRTLGPNVRLKLDLGREDLSAQCDPTQLEMAILNLAINARDAMEANGELAIKMSAVHVADNPTLRDGEYVELSVCDTGPGMPPDVVERAFDPFFTTKGAGKGTGLGLSQVYASAKQAGGIARIESEEGVGTTVRLYLPRTTAASGAPEEQQQDSPVATISALVLVVDDDPDVRSFLEASLSSLGYKTLVAEDGYAGLAALDCSEPDVMIVDFAMPGISGAEVAQAARKRRPDIPIIFSSGYSDTTAIADMAGPGAPLLRKPFRVDQLEAALARCPTLRRRPG